MGSFGEDVVKIELTRRLEPDDRVRELGDASVPFSFDTHALIYSDEAPALENALHNEFEERRVNMSNARKEFFGVTLDEVEEAVTRLAPDANFFKDCEAQEWHETLARRNQLLAEMHPRAGDTLPATISRLSSTRPRRPAPRAETTTSWPMSCSVLLRPGRSAKNNVVNDGCSSSNWIWGRFAA